MKFNKQIHTFFALLLLAGFIIPLFGVDTASAVGPVEIPGCCTTAQGGGECLDCPEGASCLTSSLYCAGEGGFFSEAGVCFDSGAGATCGTGVAAEGCCVIEPGNCQETENANVCFEFTSQIFPDFFAAGASCEEIPQCTPIRNIPTMSNLGLYALAAVFILVGIWAITRKRTEA